MHAGTTVPSLLLTSLPPSLLALLSLPPTSLSLLHTHLLLVYHYRTVSLQVEGEGERHKHVGFVTV